MPPWRREPNRQDRTDARAVRHRKGKPFMTHTMKELADFLGCVLEGDGSAIVSGVASPASARPEDLIYVESPHHLDRAEESASRCVVISPGFRLAEKRHCCARQTQN